MIIQEIQKKIIPILKKNRVKRASLFGSVSRGESNKKSDVDILVELEDGKTLLDLAGLKIELEKKLKRDVDLLTYRSVHPYVKKYIIKDAIEIYAQG